MTEPTTLEPITALIPSSRVEELKAIAKADDRSLSWLIRRAVDDYVEARGRAAA